MIVTLYLTTLIIQEKLVYLKYCYNLQRKPLRLCQFSLITLVDKSKFWLAVAVSTLKLSLKIFSIKAGCNGKQVKILILSLSLLVYCSKFLMALI